MVMSTTDLEISLLLHIVVFSFIQTMEIMQDGEELVFLYQLIDGYTNSSYACHIASLAGLSVQLVKRGAEVHRDLYSCV